MDIVEDLSAVDARDHDPTPLCVIARPTDRRLIAAATTALGLPDTTNLEESRAHPHPRAHVDGEDVFVLAFAATNPDPPIAVELMAAKAGLLVITEDAVVDIVRRQVRPVDGDGRVALAAVLVGLGHATGEALDDLADEVRDVAARAMGFTSGPERTELTEMRASLFIVRQLCAEHENMLGPDEDFVRNLPKASLRSVRQARAAFAEAEATATRVHTLAGDVLSQQSALVSERLTLVATIFLPLTVGTAFFGMNFGWMTARIGTAAAFFGLGLVFPLLLTVGTVIITGRMTGGRSTADGKSRR